MTYEYIFIGKLRFVITSNYPSHEQLLQMIKVTENDLLSNLSNHFVSFLDSKYYFDWQQSQVQENKLRRKIAS